ncbi:MAG: hypothetical protein E7472_02615 [Ruminococcaceae bacterium]|nr:hypothetical protein [Oscillospiraceae bacterium]
MNQLKFNQIRSDMRTCLSAARQVLYQKLDEHFKDNPNSLVKGNGRACHGITTKMNDRAEYYWISVMIEDKKYWLTLFYNEVDTGTGNIHTQFGRIQFWRDVNGKTPNGEAIINRQLRWFLIPEKSAQPCNKPTYIGDPDYCPKTVVEQFLEFINNDIQRKEAKI